MEKLFKISKVCQFNENVLKFEVLILSLLSMDEIQTLKIMLRVYLLSGLDEGLLFWPHLDLYIIF